MISFIIPAHNEEAWIGHCISAIRNAMKPLSEVHEIVVVDDASIDSTSSVAQQHGARVIKVDHRHISASRNAGAREARGDILFFVDADTLVNVSVIQAGLRAIHDGASGGGFIPRYDGVLPLWFKMLYPIFVLIVRLLRQPGGSCLFCTRCAFDATGGFSRIHYAAEDALFVTALKRHGRFIVPREPTITSGRNIRAHSIWSFARLVMRFALHGVDGFRDRQGLDMWYKPLRTKAKDCDRND